jgi:hypothetical protein
LSGIVWLASYPKSGNTWLRVFLTNYHRDRDTPADINQLNATPIASSRDLFDDQVGLAASDLLPREAAGLRAELYEHLARQGDGPLVMKVHDAYLEVSGRPLFPSAASRAALYVIRNPLDVAVSFAHHCNNKVSRTVRQMGSERFSMAAERRRLPHQLPQRLGSWSGHVRSWVDDAPFPVEVIRYEDMQADAEASFARAARLVFGEVDLRRLRKAIAFSGFDVLKKMEEEHGFNERPPGAPAFFRRGRVGAWRESLSDDDVRRLVEDHAEVMARFGYSTDLGALLAELRGVEAVARSGA